MNKPSLWAGGFGSLTALLSFVVFGAISDVIPNPFFSRMSPVGIWEWFFLVALSLLLGIYIGLRYLVKKGSTSCNAVATGGFIGGFLGFGCALCYQLLVLLFGVVGVTAYFMPLQPLIGTVGIALLCYAVYAQWRQYMALPPVALSA